MTGPVERRGQQRPPAFAQRCLGDQPRRFVQHLGGASDAEERREAEVLGGAAHVQQPSGFQRRRLPVLEPLERPAAPERQGVARGRRGPVGFAEGQQLPGALDGPFEPVDVERVGRQGEPVAVVGGLDRCRAQAFTQTGDATLEVLGGGGRRVVAPEGVGQLVRGDGAAPARDQGQEHDAVAWAEAGGLAVEFEWAQNPEQHGELSSVRGVTSTASRGPARSTLPAPAPAASVARCGVRSWGTQDPAVAARQRFARNSSSSRMSSSGTSWYLVGTPSTVTCPLNVGSPSYGSMSVPTTRNSAGHCAGRRSQSTPWVVWIIVRSSPRTSKVWVHRVLVRNVAVGQASGDVLRYSMSLVRDSRS
jgi:hypothetical protein